MKDRPAFLANANHIYRNLFRLHPFVQKTAMELRRHFSQVCLSADMYKGYLEKYR